MRMSRLFGTTLREAPAGAESESHTLLVRAGFIRQLGQGLFSSLPLARRSLARIEALLRKEMDAMGGQEMAMPVVNPADLWKATGRWDSIDQEMVRFRDRRGRDMALAMTHEEVIVELCRTEIRSWRQLPKLVYQIQTKFRDDPRPRAGLLRVREFTMKDSYSLDADQQGLDLQYRAHHAAYLSMFARCGLPVLPVGSDSGMMGGSVSREFMYLTPAGEDTIIRCARCGYAANRQVAEFVRQPLKDDGLKPLEKVATPGCTTIDELARLLGIPRSRTAKAVFMMSAGGGEPGAGERFVFAVVRGDREVNETKLARAVKAVHLRPAAEEEIRAAGAVPGYASPIGLRPTTLIMVDDEVAASTNLVAGANQEGFHLLNTNIPRDYTPTSVSDIASAAEGDGCKRCGAPLSVTRGVEVGHIFKLGVRYSESIGATYQDPEGREKPVVMGSYGIGLGRLLACIAEEHHDERGLRWPVTVAPYDAHLVSLGGPGTEVRGEAERLYTMLAASGVDVLFDDREESPGVKFADADLIGAPLRLTVSARSMKSGGAEMKRRDREEKIVVPSGDVVGRVAAELASLRAERETAAEHAREGGRLG
ncbi:MAG: proline--tRNA ligase [Spirochaetia bacterium]